MTLTLNLNLWLIPIVFSLISLLGFIGFWIYAQAKADVAYGISLFIHGLVYLFLNLLLWLVSFMIAYFKTKGA